MGSVPAVPIEPDTKDWTWVLDRACPECGFDAPAVALDQVGAMTRDNAAAWLRVLARPRDELTTRPRDDRWSALEYACHVRDVYRLFDTRLRSMLDTDNPRFVNWDQDLTAVEDRYDLQDPATVSAELVEAGNAFASLWDTVTPEQLGRRGVRSDGAEFTVETFGIYFLHDPTHHVDDVVRGNAMLADGQLD